MKKLYFKGSLIELNVSSIDEDDLEGFREGDYDSDDIRDGDMENIFNQYNVELESGIFKDEDDNIVDIKFIPIYCSNIGEPLLELKELWSDDIIETISDSYGEDGFDTVYEELSNNGQFKDGTFIDPVLLETFRDMISVNEGEPDILVSSKSIEDGDGEIIIPDEFDKSKPICIGTHEIEFTGDQIGTVIMQYNNGKLLVRPLEFELESSTTEYTDIYYMVGIEVNSNGRIMSEDFDQI